MADFQYFSLFEREDVSCPGLAGKQRHFAEKVALIERRDRARTSIFTDLDPNPSFMYYKHRGTRVARSYNRLAGREDVTDRRLCQHGDLFGRQRGEDIHGGQPLGDSTAVAVPNRGSLSLDEKGSGRISEVQTSPAERVPDS